MIRTSKPSMALGVCLVLGVAAAALVTAAPTPAPAADVKAYTVDPGHSGVVFSVNHLAVSRFWGRFNSVDGRYRFSPDAPGASSIEITIPIESIDTNSTGRDRHLRSDAFFDAEAHTAMTFKSTSIEAAGGTMYRVKGDMTMRGVTKPVIAKLEWIGSGDRGAQFGYRSGFEARFEVKRSDFGMDRYIKEGLLGDEVRIIVFIEGILAKAG